MTIDEVMKATAARYGATHFPFRQGDLLFRGNDQMPRNGGRGVCAALCRLWLHRGHGRLVPSATFSDWAHGQADAVVDKQQRINAKVGPSAALTKVAPKWGTPTMTIYNLGQPPTVPFMTTQDIMQAAQGVMKYRSPAYADLNTFWREAIAGMTHFHSGKNYITLTWTAKNSAHAVAIRENGGKCYFFDPNGGIMRFKELDLLRDWLRDEYPTAGEYPLQGLTVEVFNYKPTA